MRATIKGGEMGSQMAVGKNFSPQRHRENKKKAKEH
jgi:hypothetical protein